MPLHPAHGLLVARAAQHAPDSSRGRRSMSQRVRERTGDQEVAMVLRRLWPVLTLGLVYVTAFYGCSSDESSAPGSATTTSAAGGSGGHAGSSSTTGGIGGVSTGGTGG